MAKKEKISKSKTDNKFFNASEEEKLRILQSSSNAQRVRLIHTLRNEAKEEALAAKLSGFKQYWNKNKHLKGAGRAEGFGRKGEDTVENISTLTPEQENLQELAQTEFGKGLPGLLEQLRQPYRPHPVNQRLEDIFAHLQNPILQGLTAPPRGALFPSEIEQEYMQGPPMAFNHDQQLESQQPSPFGDLFSALGRHGIEQYVNPWLAEQKPEDIQRLYNKGVKQYGQPAYNYLAESRPAQYAQNLYGGAMHHLGAQGFPAHLGREAVNDIGALGSYGKQGINNILSYLGNKFSRGGNPQ